MHLPKIEALSEALFDTERGFAPRTPHSYAHTGAQVLRRFHLLPSQEPKDTLGANIVNSFPDLPEAAIYYFPDRAEDRGA